MSDTPPENSSLETYRQALIQKIDSESLKLPILSEVAREVLLVTSDPNSDVGDLSNLIHRDQSLAGNVLRVSNSAAYAGGNPIVSLKQAVTRLGMKLLGEIAISVSMQGDVFIAPGYDEENKSIWHHALASGLYGKEVARAKRKNVEGLFLCGLMHTVGKPVILQTLADIKRSVGQKLSLELVRLLMEEFHRTVGNTVAKQWGLPEQVQVTIGSYHKYETVTSFQDETAMTYLSDRLALWLTEPEALSREDLIKDPVFQNLNFYPDDVEALLNKRDAVYQAVSAMSL